VVVLVGFVGVLGNWSLHVEPLAGNHLVHVFRHRTIRVALDDEIEIADGICDDRSVRELTNIGFQHTFVGNGSVWTNNGLVHFWTLVLGEKSS